MTRHSLMLPLCLLLLLAGAGCGGQKTNGADAGGVNTEVTVTPGSPVVTVGQTQAFHASLALGGGWSWKVVPASLGTFSGDGVFLAQAAGSGVVVATWSTDVRYVGTTQVQVLPAPTAAITTQPTVNAGNAPLVASVPAQPGCTYAWVVTGGTILSGADGATLTYMADQGGPVRLTCTVTNPAGVQAQTQFQVNVVQAPSITLFQGLPVLVRTGAATQLYAVFQGADQGIVTPGGFVVSSGGSIPVSLAQSTQFTLTVTNSIGTQVQAVTTVLVGDPCPPGNPAAGDLWTDPATGLDLVWCPPGSYQMGAVPGDVDAQPWEGPAHAVSFAQGFWMSRGKITQDQWQALMGANPAFFSDLTPCDRFGAAPARPVEQVSWEDAQEFLGRLNDRLGWDAYRLPSEAEWEYAYRAGTTGRFYWGDDATAAARWAWFADNANLQTWVVGQYRPNPWNFCDMAGDTLEWVADRYQPDYGGAPVDGQAVLNLGTAYRTLRGSSWNDPEECLRASARYTRPQGARSRTIGFRVVRPPCTAPLLASFTASPEAQLPVGGGLATLTWSVSGASSVRIDPGIGAVGASGSRQVSVGATTEFTLSADNSDGWAMAAVKVEVAQ
jgi:formylglycine-generating enzyme required for sulfatase activity